MVLGFLTSPAAAASNRVSALSAEQLEASRARDEKREAVKFRRATGQVGAGAIPRVLKRKPSYKTVSKPESEARPSLSKSIQQGLQRRGSLARQNRAQAMKEAEEQLAKEAV
jgi:hypothetical protein